MVVHGFRINFAHRTFCWSNEGKGVAAVHCVIVGFSQTDTPNKTIFCYDDIRMEPRAIEAHRINAYLVDADNVLPTKRTHPLSNATPTMVRGCSPVDGGNLLLSAQERTSLLAQEPDATKYLKRYTMGHEFINGIERWCLWLENISPESLRALPLIYQRVQEVHKMRLASKKKATVELASQPMLFGEIREPTSFSYLAIPKVSSERRDYIPIAFLDKNTVCGDKLFFIANASLQLFAVITSSMHMAWMRTLCGRLKSDYSYSNTIVYNNFPQPSNFTSDQEQRLEQTAQRILDARNQFPNSTLADLYDPNAMPTILLHAHNDNNKAVDAAYGYKASNDDAERVAFLLKLYKEAIEKDGFNHKK